MNLEIRSETRLSFEIDYGPSSYILRAKGGDWELVGATSGSWQSLGSVKRVSWLGALRKAMEAIDAYDNDRDGV